jgi:error-prone DNA polymerase
MGFYSPATITKDAQRHGLKILPVDVTHSEWMCTLETVVSDQLPVVSEVVGRSSLCSAQGRLGTVVGQPEPGCVARALLPASAGETPALRLGLRYVRGLREEGAQALVHERRRAAFTSIHDLTRRVPELRKDELTTLAEIGALNRIGSPPRRHGDKFPTADFPLPIESTPLDSGSKIDNRKLSIENSFHRRDALWQVERAVRSSGPLLEKWLEPDVPSPLQPMNHEERLVADFRGTGLTVGPHAMAYRREWLNAMGIRRASELRDIPSGKRLRIGGCVIVRQRPGTAKGFVFLSLEDETGVANAIIAPDLFHSNRLLLASERFLAVEGILQNQDNVISVKAERVLPLFVTKAETVSHDFH